MSAATEAEKAAFMEGKRMAAATMARREMEGNRQYLKAGYRSEDRYVDQENIFREDLLRLVREPELIEGFSATLTHALCEIGDAEICRDELEGMTYEECRGAPVDSGTTEPAQPGLNPAPASADARTTRLENAIEDNRDLLRDVQALLQGARALVRASTPGIGTEPLNPDALNNLLKQAQERTDCVVDDLGEHI